jgi:preprotein translocase subunit SecF
MRRFFAHANFDFLGRRRIAYLCSGGLFALGIAFAIFHQVTHGSWVNYGVDFAGGSIVQVSIASAPSEEEVRRLAAERVPGSQVSRFGSDEYLIRTPGSGADVATGPAEQVLAALRERYGGEQNVESVRVEQVGAKVGSELQQKALIAILISLLATLIYLAFRFEWRFGVAAIVATAHDVLLTIAVILILRMEVSLPTVAAVLTILGYSLNDTIVVFDRIRENLRAARRPEYASLLNRSINETLPRTILTGSATLATLFSLYVFGGEIIREFALILILGIVLGTYSSIFIGSPALLEIEKRFPHQQPTVKRPRTSAPRPSRV